MLVDINNWVASGSVKFWEWVQSCLEGTGLIAKAVSAIAKAFGLDSVSIDAKINKAKGSMLEYADVGDAVSTAFNVVPYANMDAMYKMVYSKGNHFGHWLTDKLGNVTTKGVLVDQIGSVAQKSSDYNTIDYNALKNYDTLAASDLTGNNPESDIMKGLLA